MTLSEDIRTKLINLNELAERATNEHEAAAARGALAKLMAKHGLTSADLTVPDDEPDDFTIIEPDLPLYDGKQITRWRSRLAGHIAELHGVYNWFDPVPGGWSCRLVGPEHGIQATRYLFEMLERDVERHAKRHKGKGRKYLNSFRHGVVSTLQESLTQAYGEALAELRDEAPNSKALVRLESAQALYNQAQTFTKDKYDLGSMGSSQASIDRDAYEQGREEGRSINVGGKGAAITVGAPRLGAGA